MLGKGQTDQLANIRASIHPELLPAVDGMLARWGEMPPLSDDTLAAARSAPPFDLVQPRADILVERRSIPGAEKAPQVTVYIINSKSGANRPAILHMHGGGFVRNTAQTTIRLMQDVAAAVDCVVVSVDYRLAPETRFADSKEDNYAALCWLHTHADEIGADRSKIAVMGESAGAGHAALLALAARDRGDFQLCFQALLYPMLDDRTGSSRQLPGHIGAFGWTAGDNAYGWSSFLGREPGGPDVPSAAVPARADDLSGLPPTFIAVGSIDLFVDESIEYAQRLLLAGVPTELQVFPGAYHGFDVLARDTPPAQRFNQAKLDALRHAFGQNAPPRGTPND